MQFDNQNLRCVNTLAQLTDTEIPPSHLLNNCLSLWNNVWINNDMRNFMFKFRNNDLGLNNRLNAFDATVDPRCTFCRIIDPDSTMRDGLNHAFFECPTARTLLRTTITKCEPVPDIDSRNFRQLFWYGTEVTEDEAEDGQLFPNANLPGLLIFETFRYTLWKFRLRRKVPNPAMLNREFDFALNLITIKSKKLRDSVASSNLLANFLQARG